MRRFLLHVLPKGLMRVRHYGLLGHSLRLGWHKHYVFALGFNQLASLEKK